MVKAVPTKPAPNPARPTCGLCGADVRAPFKIPPSDSSPDLDMRPGEPARSTLRRWIITCPVCEASAPDLSRLRQADQVVMALPSYFALRGPRASIPFQRWALLCPKPERAEALLQAAWACDDLDEAEAARILRRQAAANWPTPMPLSSALRLVDVLRRAADFAGALAQVEAIHAIATDETTARIVAYQRKLIDAKDTGRHLLSSAVPQPARMPHVAKPAPASPPAPPPQAKGGFWAWLRR